MTASNRDTCDRVRILWVMKSGRVVNMLQDEGYRCLLVTAPNLPGLYLPSSAHNVQDKWRVRIATEGLDHAKHFVLKLREDGIKVTIAGDIYGTANLSVLGLTGCGITSEWVMKKVILGVVPFEKRRHTGGNIQSVTNQALEGVDISDQIEHVWRKRSDAASDM